MPGGLLEKRSGRGGESEAAGEGFLQEVTREGSLEGWGQSISRDKTAMAVQRILEWLLQDSSVFIGDAPAAGRAGPRGHSRGGFSLKEEAGLPSSTQVVI